MSPLNESDPRPRQVWCVLDGEPMLGELVEEPAGGIYTVRVGGEIYHVAPVFPHELDACLALLDRHLQALHRVYLRLGQLTDRIGLLRKQELATRLPPL